MSRDDAHILDMLLAARKVAEAVENITYDEFDGDWMAQSAVEHQLMILGEAVKRLSPEFRQRYPHIPWAAIAGHRDILIHQYDKVDLEEVWIIAKEKIPPLIAFLMSIAPSREVSE